MPSKLPMNEPQNVWQNQPTEAFKMSADQLRHRAEERQRKARFSALFSIVISVIGFVIFARELATVPKSFSPLVLAPLSLWSMRIGFSMLCLWCVYLPYRTYKRIWPGRLAPDATLNVTVQSYRRELEKQRDSGRNRWGVLAFFSLAMAMVAVPMVMVRVPAPFWATPQTGPQLLLNWAPFLLLAMAWVIMIRLMYRSRRKLLQEIEQLRETENRS